MTGCTVFTKNAYVTADETVIVYTVQIMHRKTR